MSRLAIEQRGKIMNLDEFKAAICNNEHPKQIARMIGLLSLEERKEAGLIFQEYRQNFVEQNIQNLENVDKVPKISHTVENQVADVVKPEIKCDNPIDESLRLEAISRGVLQPEEHAGYLCGRHFTSRLAGSSWLLRNIQYYGGFIQWLN